MPIEVTEEAAEVLKRSLELGGVDRSEGGIRLRGARSLSGGFDVQVELAAGPEGDEQTIEAHGVRVFVGADVLEAMPDAVVDLELQHDIVSVRPAAEGTG
jgi:Fe-S cluster assembly iron-binding protein IscA